MKANELMIGDWVLTLDSTHKEKVFAQIDAIEEGQHSILVTRESSNWFVDIDWVEPISLTPEILEKNGFVLESYSGGVMSGKWWTRNDFVIHESMNDSVGRNNFKYEYVHQLQHALRLCGIEKEIIL